MKKTTLTSLIQNSFGKRDPHFKFFGTSVLVSIMLLGVAWMMALLHFRFTIDSPEVLSAYFGFSLILVNLVGFGLIAYGAWAARRLASTHAQLIETCRLVQEGDFNTRLQLKKHDELPELQAAFNKMLDSISQRVRA